MVCMTKTKAAIESMIRTHGSYTIGWTLLSFIVIFIIMQLTGFPIWLDLIVAIVLWYASGIVQRKIDKNTVEKLV